MPRFFATQSGLAAAVFAAVALASCRQDAPEVVVGPVFAKAASGPSVSSADPNAATRDTTLDVRILGSGFGSGSRADFLLAGAPDPKVRTNNTRFVSSTELVANITIDAAAVPNYRDVAVTTAAGKKGVGTEAFIVLQAGEIAPAGLANPFVWDVNSSGLAVGGGSLSGTACNGQAFAWSQTDGGTMLPVAAGFCGGTARRVNDMGVIAGNVGTTGGVAATQIARWTPAGGGTWSVDVLPKPGANLLWLTLHGLNAGGHVVSAWKNPDGTWDSWFWSDGTGWRRLARPSGATWCYAEDMNDADQITGYCNGAVSPGGAVYWASPTSPGVRLPGFGGNISNKASAVNNLGIIAGSYVSGSQAHAARWRPNGSGGWLVDDLGALGNVTGLNDAGAMAGSNKGDGFYISAGSVMEILSPFSPPASSTAFITLGNSTSDGITWLVGWGLTGQSGGYRALWWKR